MRSLTYDFTLLLLLHPNGLNQSLQLSAHLSIAGVICISESGHIHMIGLNRLCMLASIVK